MDTQGWYEHAKYKGITRDPLISVPFIRNLLSKLGKDEQWVSYRCQSMLLCGILYGKKGVLLEDDEPKKLAMLENIEDAREFTDFTLPPRMTGQPEMTTPVPPQPSLEHQIRADASPANQIEPASPPPMQEEEIDEEPNEMSKAMLEKKKAEPVKRRKKERAKRINTHKKKKTAEDAEGPLVYGKLLGALKALSARVMGVLQAPARNLLLTLKAYVAKLEEESCS
ncbi:hypothetical protein SELMODRAFT_431565 [Selaginella moellendorffii]|uniref:Uncharacterized protein n=1 Tax=Selaginella moellendorffii TaxID=88036 RepID=D8TD26_SELML|nr:hypothetical protein SELMODRAFT_431565 [Selaginella moellendorffii]